MKSFLQLTVVMVLLSRLCYAQIVVQKVQMPLCCKETATWCGPCGEWGWDFENELTQERGSVTVMMQNHASSLSQLFSQAAADIQYQAIPQANGTPAWFVNNYNKIVDDSSGIYLNETKANILNSIDSTRNITEPLAQTGFTHSLNGRILTINTKTKFFKSDTGEYYLAMYIIEDNVVNYQNGQGSFAKHKHILRSAMTSASFGEMLTSGNITANQEFPKTYIKTIDNSWNLENITLASVIWEKEGTTYKYVNAFTKFTYLSNEFQSKNQANFNTTLYPNPSQLNATLDIELKDVSNNLTINLQDLTGKTIKNIFNGNLSQGEHSFDIQQNNIPNGMYFVQIQSNGQTVTQKLIFN